MKTCNDAPVGYTDHPPVGEWQGWNGGACPVHPLANVDYMMANGNRCRDDAEQLHWRHTGDSWDIIAYRIVEEYKLEPEKVACEVYMRYDDSRGWVACHDEFQGATLFREVIQ